MELVNHKSPCASHQSLKRAKFCTVYTYTCVSHKLPTKFSCPSSVTRRLYMAAGKSLADTRLAPCQTFYYLVLYTEHTCCLQRCSGTEFNKRLSSVWSNSSTHAINCPQKTFKEIKSAICHPNGNCWKDAIKTRRNQVLAGYLWHN